MKFYYQTYVCSMEWIYATDEATRISFNKFIIIYYNMYTCIDAALDLIEPS